MYASRVSSWIVYAGIVLLVACGGGDSGSSGGSSGGGGGGGGGGGSGSTSYSVGGTVTGLSGSGLTLKDNGGDSLSVAGNGTFKFATSVANSGAYSVTVATQPATPTQNCTVSNGSGSVSGGNVTNVAVSCSTDTFEIKGQIAGLTGSGLVLQNNGGDNLSVATNATDFTFATSVNSGATYNVTVLSQPGTPSQICTVASGSGTVGGGDVTNVTLTCAAAGAGTAARVVIDQTSVFLAGLGQTAQLHANVLDGAGNVLAQQPITWTSSAGDQIAVSTNGTVTAVAIGSAQITATSGSLQSHPTLAFVAQPAAGALLLTDSQIVAVGTAQNLDADGIAGVGTQYDVTVTGVTTPPAPGTIVIGTQTQNVSGSVVSTRQDTSGLIVTLAIVPVSQLFTNYNLQYTVDLSSFPMQQAPSEAVQDTDASAAAGTPVGTIRKIVPRRKDESPVAPFKALDCDAKVKATLLGDPPFQLTVTNQLTLKVEDRPGYTLRVIQGSFTLNPQVALSIKAGVAVSGSCEAAAQIPIPVDGPIGLFVVPAVRVGLGVDLGGALVVAQGKIGVSGSLGVGNVSIGYQCTETNSESTCDTLNGADLVNELKPLGQFPDVNGMRLALSGQFYFLAGLDVSFLLDTVTADLLRAKIGPKQSFDLGFETDQLEVPDYASSYDLKLVGNIELGKSLSKVLKTVMGGDIAEVKAQPQFSTDISQSPKGTLTASTAHVSPGTAMDFTVQFDPTTTNYFLIGPNVAGVALYRKKQSEDEFTKWKDMDLTTSGVPQYQYHWTPDTTDVGKADYAAMVNTNLLPEGFGPLLEVSPNSVTNVEVSCFSSGTQSTSNAAPALIRAVHRPSLKAAPQDGGTCADTWTGNMHYDDSDYYGDVTVTWVRDPNVQTPSPTAVGYRGVGHATFHNHVWDTEGCTADPSSFDFDAPTATRSAALWVDYSFSPPLFGFAITDYMFAVTQVCPGLLPELWHFSLNAGTASGYVSADGSTISGTPDPTVGQNASFTFSR